MKKIFILNGSGGVGKDTFVYCVKDYVIRIKGKYVEHISSVSEVKKKAKQLGWDGEKDEKGRTLLQYVGTDIIGTKRPGYWVMFIVDLLRLFENEWDYVIIPDCRYPIEYETMRNNFDTTLIRVERPYFDNGLTEAQKNHPSEVAMDNYAFEYIIENKWDMGILKNKVKR